MNILRNTIKLVGAVVLAFALTSCLDSNYSQSYSLIANFEYGNSVKFRADSTYYAEGAYAIGYNYLAFCHTLDQTTQEFQGGFRLSALEGQIRPAKVEDESSEQTTPSESLSGEEVVLLGNTWRVHAAPAVNTYMVYHMNAYRPEYDIAFLVPTNGACLIKSCQVANAAAVAEEIAEKFERGDRLVLKATGYKDGKETKTVEINLADYTQNDKAGQPKDSIVSRWTTLDLSSLQLVDKVKFEMESTKNVQQYFCMDNMEADITLEY
jgi:uncharacterized lipoprotein YehR (DUF1307 family)